MPAGAPSRAFTVGLLSGGVDYTRPGVSAKFARDGEGEIVGWDAIDDDARPFARDPVATALVGISPILIAPFRLDLASAASWDRTLAVLAKTPIRMAVVAATPAQLGTGWKRRAAAASDVLFVVPADADGAKPELPQNVIVVAAVPPAGPTVPPADLLLGSPAGTRDAPRVGRTVATTSLEAAILLAGVVACTDLRAAKSPADVKRVLIAKATELQPGKPPMLAQCP